MRILCIGSIGPRQDFAVVSEAAAVEHELSDELEAILTYIIEVRQEEKP